MPEGANAATELIQEHAEIERIFQQIATLEPSAERSRLLDEATTRFATHAEAEEKYLFPALRQCLPRGTHDAADEQERLDATRDILEAMRRTPEDEDPYEALLGQLVLDIQQHVQRQDNVLLPTLLDACPQDQANHLGRQLRYGLHGED